MHKKMSESCHPLPSWDRVNILIFLPPTRFGPLMGRARLGTGQQKPVLRTTLNMASGHSLLALLACKYIVYMCVFMRNMNYWNITIGIRERTYVLYFFQTVFWCTFFNEIHVFDLKKNSNIISSQEVFALQIETCLRIPMWSLWYK